MADTLNEFIDKLRLNSLFSSIDLYFAELMTDLGGEDRDVFLASALLSNETGQGHVFLDIKAFAEKSIGEEEKLICPTFAEWIHCLEKSKVTGSENDWTPLVLDSSGRLYLRRYFEYQRVLSDYIIDKTTQPVIEPADRTLFKKNLEKLFGNDSTFSNDQKKAACLGCFQRFSVISGGPGTGKTTTVARFLVLCIEQHLAGRNREKPFNIHLCAPTGKAALRLKESLEDVLASMDLRDEVLKVMPSEVRTIHRLLGTVKHSPYFRYNQSNLLKADLVVVDEASMVDLALMSKLVSALDSKTSLVLIGDKDQLSSVEAGSVLGDICGAVTANTVSPSIGMLIGELAGEETALVDEKIPENSLENHITVLTKNYRFSEDSGIGALSRAVNSGKWNDAEDILNSHAFSDVTLEVLPDKTFLKEKIRPWVYESFLNIKDFSEADGFFSVFSTFRILCAVRKGGFGVSDINRSVAEILREEFNIDTRQKWYAGRPVMIVKNDYNTGLFNGDIGITVKDTINKGRFKVIFFNSDGKPESFSPDMLPEHETAYAMTVHKSQGSEFDKVLMILPEQDNPILTRELVYTGITRAKKHVVIMADEKILQSAVERRIKRKSGLGDILWFAHEHQF